jgi:hypothetical protein
MRLIYHIADYADETPGFRCCGNTALSDKMARTICLPDGAKKQNGVTQSFVAHYQWGTDIA